MTGLLNGLGEEDPRYKKGNNYFPPLTPEQESMLRKQGIRETAGPLDLIMGAGLGAMVPGGLLAIPMGAASKLLGGNYLSGALGGHLIGSGVGVYSAANELPNVRARQNTIRDAEGQPGGFYGRR